MTPELVPESPYIWRARRPDPARRLICFPHAGAGAATYADWVRLVPPDIELVAVQLPGRQNRIAEDPFTEVPPLVSALTQALRLELDRPVAFFGHSCGAQLAHELARALHARGRRLPEHLFLSALPAPGTAGIPLLHDLAEDEFHDEVIRLGGVSAEIAADETVMESLLPLLRADFALWERHPSRPGPPLPCPVTVLCGAADPRVPLDSLPAWAAHTTGGFATHVFPGGHFYFLDDPAGTVGTVVAAMLEGSRT